MRKTVEPCHNEALHPPLRNLREIRARHSELTYFRTILKMAEPKHYRQLRHSPLHVAKQ